MPTAILNAYMVMLPRLEAEETLAQVLAVSLGMGGAGEPAGKRLITQLQRQARGQKLLPESKRVTGREFAAMLGIPIKVKKKEAPRD